MTNPLSEIDFTKSLSMINSISFIALALEEYTKSFDFEDSDKETLRYSSLLLSIAGIHYSILDVNNPTPLSESIIRYSDWITTTPLLLIVLGKYYDISFDLIKIWIILDLIMIIGGIAYELTGEVSYWIVGTLAYFVLLYNLFHQLPEHDLFYKYFVIGWSFYGVIALLPDQKQRFFYYNFLDFYNKFIFAYEIRLKIIDRNNNI
jgi:bacteriorhodopsin